MHDAEIEARQSVFSRLPVTRASFALEFFFVFFNSIYAAMNSDYKLTSLLAMQKICAGFVRCNLDFLDRSFEKMITFDCFAFSVAGRDTTRRFRCCSSCLLSGFLGESALQILSIVVIHVSRCVCVRVYVCMFISVLAMWINF